MEDVALAVLPRGPEENVESDSGRSMESISTEDLGIDPQKTETNPVSLNSPFDDLHLSDMHHQYGGDFTIDGFHPFKQSEKHNLNEQSFQTLDQTNLYFSCTEIKSALYEPTDLPLESGEDEKSIKIRNIVDQGGDAQCMCLHSIFHDTCLSLRLIVACRSPEYELSHTLGSFESES